jgi:Nitric oxide synthase, oxygenase domain
MVKTSVATSPAGPDARPDGLARACPVMDSLVQDHPGMDSPGTDSPGTDSPGADGPDSPSPGTTGPGATGPATDSPPADRHAPASTPRAAPAGTATRPARSLWPARAFRTARLTALRRSGRSGRPARPVDMDAAAEFIQMHRREVPGAGPAGPRLREIRREISLTGTYRHTVDELEFGARVAWRNSSRCIGRLYWKSLKIRDRREVDTAAGVAAECAAHL